MSTAIISFSAIAKATAFATALGSIAGSTPAITNQGGFYEIALTPDQEDRVAEWIRAQLNKDPGDVRVDLGGVALKVIARQYWPWIAGAVAFGGFLGYMGRRS